MPAHSFRPFAVALTCLLFIVSLTSCGPVVLGSSTQSGPPPTSQAENSTPIISSASPTPTIILTPTSPPGPVPFRITHLSYGVTPGDHVGMCGANTFFTATVFIYAPAHNTGGTVTYTWLRNDTSTIPLSTVTFPPGTTSEEITTIWSLLPSQGNGGAYTVAFQTRAPQVFTTPTITYHFSCQRLVQSINASVSPGQGCHSVSQNFLFSAVVTVSPGANGVQLTYDWKRSDGSSGATTTVTIPQSAATITLSDIWKLPAPSTLGTYWEELSVTAPNGVVSNQASFTITSC